MRPACPSAPSNAAHPIRRGADRGRAVALQADQGAGGEGGEGGTLPFLALPPPFYPRLVPLLVVLQLITVHAANVDYPQA